MESRKIQTSVAGSYIITLPKKWASEAGFKKGDRLDISVEEDGSLRIIPPVSHVRSSPIAQLRVERYSGKKILDLCIKACYIQGNDTIEISSKGRIGSEYRRWVKESIAELIGAEIAEETPDTITIQVLVDPGKFNFDRVFKRFSSLSLSVYEDSVKALREKTSDLARDALERGRESAKLYRLMMRQVTQAAKNRGVGVEMGIEDAGEAVVRAVVARDLSRLAYHAKRTAQHVLNLRGQELRREIVEVVVDMASTASQMHHDAVTAFFTKDVNRANATIAKMETLRRLFEEAVTLILQTEMLPQTAVNLTLMIRDIRAIGGYAIAIADDSVLRAFCQK